MIDPLTTYILEEHYIREGWGDVAASVAGKVGGAVARDAKRTAAKKRIGGIQMRIKKVTLALKACGDKRLCKLAKHAQLVALRNGLADAKQAVRNG